MKFYEHQAKEMIARFEVPVPPGQVAFTSAEAVQAFHDLANNEVVLKAQVYAGGRGKAGGIKRASSAEQVRSVSESMLGMNLVTAQTGARGVNVKRLLIEPAVSIERELYAGIVLDRSRQQLVFMTSQEGGIEIERVAKESPEKIQKEFIDPAMGLQIFQARRMAFALGLEGNANKQAIRCFLNLYKAFIHFDCSLLEINPLVITDEQNVLALDLKMNIDDNALYRQKDAVEMHVEEESDPLEKEAASFHLSYIKLNGSVGCMVNGAGLAMATMDLVKTAGAQPANFLDVGGTASAETIANGFRIILADKNVKTILVNIFGGIVRCDRVAHGIVDAANKVNLNVPVVVRLAGTNAERAFEILKKSNVDIIIAPTLNQAANEILNALYQFQENRQ